MRGLYLSSDQDTTSDTLSRILCNTPGGVLFPRLERLFWNTNATHNALAFFRLFLSPQLKRVTLRADPVSSDTPSDLLAAIARIISSLPTSLDHLFVISGQGKGPISDSISSFICRCGSSLRYFGTRVPLSEASIHHLAQLPDLRYLNTAQGPPQTIPPFIFPSLEQLRLAEPAALPWIHLLASQGGRARGSSTSATLRANARETLNLLECPDNTIVDSSLLASITMFQNLVTLIMHASCSGTGGCTFRLTDGNMESFAAALPRLKKLELGEPCHFNSCNTTVASLLSISNRCLDLVDLETHFNTVTIVSDMQRLVGGGTGRDKVRCELRRLAVGFLPLDVCEEDIETVAMGLKVIFPCLLSISCPNGSWCEVQSGLRAIDALASGGERPESGCNGFCIESIGC